MFMLGVVLSPAGVSAFDIFFPVWAGPDNRNDIALGPRSRIKGKVVFFALKRE